MSTIVSGIYNRGMNLAKVAKEIVVDTYSNASSGRELLTDVKDKILHIDQVYLDAAKKVTAEPEEEIKDHLEYRIFNFGTQKIAQVQKTAEAGIAKAEEVRDAVRKQRQRVSSKLSDTTTDAKLTFAKAKEAVTNTAQVKLRTAQEKMAGLRSRSLVLAKATMEEVKSRTLSVRKSLAETAQAASEKFKLTPLLETAQQKFAAARKFTAEEFAFLKTSVAMIVGSVYDKVSSGKLLEKIKSAGAKGLESIKNALVFLQETYRQNSQVLSRFGFHAKRFFSNFWRKNKQLLDYMRVENKKLVANYAKKFDVEVYYTPTESVRLMDKVRGATGWFAHRNGAPDGREVFLAEDSAKAD